MSLASIKLLNSGGGWGGKGSRDQAMPTLLGMGQKEADRQISK